MYDIVVIGGGVSGFVAAVNAKRFYPSKKVVVIEKNPKKLIPCGIPYIFDTYGIDDDLMHLEKKLKKFNVELITKEVRSFDVNSKVIMLSEASGESCASGSRAEKETGENNTDANDTNILKYEKLIIATGSKPFVPPIEGIENAYFIKKDYDYLKDLVSKAKNASDITIIGGGFIGLEIADELSKTKNVTLIEAMDSLLPNSFDTDFSESVKELLSKKVRILLNSKVSKITKEEVLVNSRTIKSDLTIVATGYKPNTEMFKDVLPLNPKGFIQADDYFRVSKDVFAIGDCVEHKEFFTSNPTPLMLASTAAFDARVAAANLYNLRIIRHNKDALNIYSTVIDSKTFAAVGITEKMAKEQGFDIIVAKTVTHSTHPPKFSHSTDVTLKLIFSKKDLYLLGAQLSGGLNSAEIINILSLAIQKSATATDLYTMQIGTHPILTPPPTFYPISATAAEALKES
ncbi:NADH oxidase [Nautilia profundicola AmH]|uniref:NADH oxidase n=1 Tax=Nautilia profundicola (strain ATCC BAA-1463 / DSM 18972 / AmH) TaxID=598659 RepID=B9L9P7_NAUPA|nr:FAD-dependent oxidoreductase [Nautilia profundicola]ACM92129.1 NADH oxidase [Nautilia profundicola AmH]